MKNRDFVIIEAVEKNEIKKICTKVLAFLDGGAGTDCLPVCGVRYEYACPVLSRLWLYNVDGRLWIALIQKYLFRSKSYISWK